MKAYSHLLKLALLTAFALPFLATPALAWGCKGHQTVAVIAEKYLTPEARQFLDKLLADNPIDPQLKRYCGNFPGSLLADSSTWPDDVRNIAHNGSWHYKDWTWESHGLAETYAYGELAPKDPVEAPAAVRACSDDNNVGERLLNLHFVAGEHYQEVAAPIVEKCIAQAGVRLALLLNEAVKSLQASN